MSGEPWWTWNRNPSACRSSHPQVSAISFLFSSPSYPSRGKSGAKTKTFRGSSVIRRDFQRTKYYYNCTLVHTCACSFRTIETRMANDTKQFLVVSCNFLWKWRGRRKDKLRLVQFRMVFSRRPYFGDWNAAYNFSSWWNCIVHFHPWLVNFRYGSFFTDARPTKSTDNTIVRNGRVRARKSLGNSIVRLLKTPDTLRNMYISRIRTIKYNVLPLVSLSRCRCKAFVLALQRDDFSQVKRS